jgi:CBS domain containing-hemolysin-like protein
MQSLTVKDLMVLKDKYATISADATLRDAALALYEAQLKELTMDPTRHRDRAVLVIDAHGEVYGKLAMLDVLRGLESRYDRVEGSRASSRAASRIGSARYVIESMGRDIGLWNKPLTNLVEKASSVKVRQLVPSIAAGESVEEDASIDVALHQLIMGRFQSLFVTRNGNIVGILRLTDVYEEISKLLRSFDSKTESASPAPE